MHLLVEAVNLSLILLLPVLPAYVLFRALPASADVSGPLQGLQLKLGGAFAGYFALLILVLGSHNIWNPPANFEVWTVDGKVEAEGVGTVRQLDIQNFNLDPGLFGTSPDGRFHLKFYTSLGQGGRTQFPNLTISYRDYEPQGISLDPARIEPRKGSIDPGGRIITLSPITIKKAPQYPKDAELAQMRSGAVMEQHQ